MTPPTRDGKVNEAFSFGEQFPSEERTVTSAPAVDEMDKVNSNNGPTVANDRATSPEASLTVDAAKGSSTEAAKGNSTVEEVNNHDGLKGWQLRTQVFSAIVVGMVSVSLAGNTAAAVMLPQLMSNESDITVTTAQGAWFATAQAICAAGGSTLGGLAVHHLGPRRVLLLQAVPTIAGWLMMALANGYPMLMVGRCLVGVCTGLSLSAKQVFKGEMSSPQIRGRLVCVGGVLADLAGIASSVIGYLMHWRWVPAGFIIFFLVPGALGMLLVPESPYWLLGRQKHDKARRSLRSFRGVPAVVEKDMAIMTESCKSRQKSLTLRDLARELKKLSVLVPFLTINALFGIRTLAGISVIVTYLVVIFQETGSALGAYQSAILLACLRMFTAVSLVLYVSDRFGRRSLLIFSGIGCTLTSLSMAAFLFARDQSPDWSGWQYISWLPLPIILAYVVAYDFGFGRTTWVVHAEILPNRVRSALSGFGILVHFTGASVSILAFPFIRGALTLAGAFCVYAFFSCIGLMLIVFFIPETKNQRLETIEAFYLHRFGKRHS